jgi:hypothetical protein
MALFDRIAKEIHKAVTPRLTVDATLTKVTQGTRTVGQLTGGTNPTSVSYSCKGFVDQQAFSDRPDAPLVNYRARVAVLIGLSIENGTVIPAQGDQLTIEGATYNIASVARDPAKATYTCELRAR